MEIELRAQIIAKVEIMEMQKNFDAKIKEHATANAKLKEQLQGREQCIHEFELKEMVREGFELLGAFNWSDHLPWRTTLRTGLSALRWIGWVEDAADGTGMNAWSPDEVNQRASKGPLKSCRFFFLQIHPEDAPPFIGCLPVKEDGITRPCRPSSPLSHDLPELGSDAAKTAVLVWSSWNSPGHGRRL